MPRRARPLGSARYALPALVVVSVAAASVASCTTVDPGPNFVVSNDTFDPDYFYCHVQPEVLFKWQCGPGAAGDNSSCHFNSGAVSGMILTDQPAIDCGGGDHPLDRTQITAIAQGNLESVSIDMNRVYTNAQIYVRPTQLATHPRQIFGTGDPAVTVISTWAGK